MKKQERTIGQIAKNYQQNSDDLLINLWFNSSFNHKFDYLESEHSLIKRQDLLIVKRIALKQSPPINKQKQRLSSSRISYNDYPTFDYSKFGKRIDKQNFLNRDDVLSIYSALTDDFAVTDDPISPSGVRDIALLESAIYHQQTSFNENYKYPTAESSAAALMYALSNNHPFYNGNKRTALVSLLVYLDRYNIGLTCKDDELFKISMSLAMHELVKTDKFLHDSEIFHLSKWIYNNEQLMKKGERSIPYRKLIQILNSHGCVYNNDRGRFERTDKAHTWGLTKKLLIFKMSVDSIKLGDEIDKGTMKNLRKQLHLDNEHGFDTDIFYSGSDCSTGEFINQYRSLLKRLSRV